MSNHEGGLEPVWKHLDPARGGAPAGFATRVMAQVRAEAATAGPEWLLGPGSLRWAPAWAKAAAAAAVLAGLLAGAGIAGWAVAPSQDLGVEVAASFGEGFADGYWQAVESEDPDTWDLSPESAERTERP